MAESVEVRVPLIDDEVVDFVSRLPGRLKARGTGTKLLLRQAVKDVVPDEVIARPKAPFAGPVRAWLRGPLRPMVDDLLSPARIIERGLLDPGVARRLVVEHRQGLEDHSLRIWALLTLEVWLQEFMDQAPSLVGLHHGTSDLEEVSATTGA